VVVIGDEMDQSNSSLTKYTLTISFGSSERCKSNVQKEERWGSDKVGISEENAEMVMRRKQDENV